MLSSKSLRRTVYLTLQAIEIIIAGSLEANFRQDGHMKKNSQEEAQPGRSSDMEKVRGEKTRDGEDLERRCRCAKR